MTSASAPPPIATPKTCTRGGASPPSTAFYRLLPSSTAFYRPLPPSTALYRLLPPSTVFYRPLPSSTALHQPWNPACTPRGIEPTNLSVRSEEHTSELQSPYVISYAVFCL